MYISRVQISNYGPIDHVDITFPFDGDIPKPVVLVGANGSGKTVLLSHIVNGLTSAKDHAFPGNPEVEQGKVFKIRNNAYIKTGSETYFAKVDFGDGWFMGELRSRRLKRDYENIPDDIPDGDAKSEWGEMPEDSNDHLFSNIFDASQNNVREAFANGCALYFPSNRFEEPAWLNQESLSTPAEYTNLSRLEGYTERRLLNYTALRNNQNWLLDLTYDRAVFETRTTDVPMQVQNGGPTVSLPVKISPTGQATSMFEIALQVLRNVMRQYPQARFGIGRRRNRIVSVEGPSGTVVPNIFQLSSGETALLNLFFSILRDYDLSNGTASAAADMAGTVLIDEVDLHLHAIHQYEVLPSLIRLFPKVQFVVTTHSPLFVLGMNETVGENGFGIYRMPEGNLITAEECSEFGDAYRAFATTSKFADDVKIAIQQAQSPILYMEGKTDIAYLQKAAQLLSKQDILAGVKIEDGNGSGSMTNIWKGLMSISDNVVARKVVILFDCDYQGQADTKGNRFKRKNPFMRDHPITKGVENLFSQATLDKAIVFNKAFIDIEPGGTAIYDGQQHTIADKWAVNQSQKTNLCNWLCENGSVDDFQHFSVIFDLLEEALDDPDDQECSSA